MSGFDTLPEWADKFNFQAHSPSAANRPNCKEFFEKVIARPNKIVDRAGCAAQAGRVCETYAKQVVIDGVEEKEAMKNAFGLFDEHEPLAHVESDEDKFKIIRDEIYNDEGTILELGCKNTLLGLRQATKGANKVEDGRWVSVNLRDVELPFIGEIDVEATGVIEIKTRWPSMTAKAKRGWQINSIPNKPDPAHVGQVALYWAWLKKQADNVPVRIVYANCRGYRVFDSADCEELSEARLNEALDRLRTIAQVRENLMKFAFENDKDLFSLVAPDFSHWMWKNVPPQYRSEAQKTWGIV